MLKNLSIKKKLYTVFAIIVSMIVILLMVAFTNFTRLSDANKWNRHSLQVINAIENLRSEILRTVVSHNRFLLTGGEQDLLFVKENEAHIAQYIRDVRSLTVGNSIQQDRLKKLEEMLADWQKFKLLPLMEQRIQLGKTSTAADQVARSTLFEQAKLHVFEMRQVLDDVLTEENRLLDGREKEVAALQRSMLVLLALGGLFCVLSSAVMAYLLSRAVSRPLDRLLHAVNRIATGDHSARAEILEKDEFGELAQQFNRMAQTIQDQRAAELQATNVLKGKVDSLLAVVSKAAAGDLTGKINVGGNDAIGQLGEGLATMFENLRILLNKVQKAGIQVATSTTEIAVSAKQQEATGIEHAQTSIEIVSTTKEISTNSAQLLKTMGEASDVAEFTTTATVEAQVNLKRMDQTMQRMVAATDSIGAKLAALSEKASNINQVLTTISKVADQTNILSLNAAIEAEKAGEAGRGFSVVATEIRRLADQTSVATWDIEQMLKEMQSAVSASVMGMDKFSEEIRRSVEEVRQVGGQLSSVIHQVQELSPRFDAVLEGMQSQAIGASQISQTMAQLNEATQQTVDSLKATSEAVHQLQYAAQDLQISVSQFAVNM